MIPESKQYYLSRNWDIFFGLLSPIERRILYTIAIDTRAGAEHITAERISGKCLCNSDRILPLLQGLESAGIIIEFNSGLLPATYFLNSHSLECYCWELPVERVFDPAEVTNELADEFNRLIRHRMRQVGKLGIDVSFNSIIDRAAQTFSPTSSKTS